MLNFGYRLVKGFRGGNLRFNRTNAGILTIIAGQLTKSDGAKK